MSRFRFSFPPGREIRSEGPTGFLVGPLPMPKCFLHSSFLLRETFPAHVQFFSQGQESDRVYVVESGIVKLVNVGLDGSTAILGLRTTGSERCSCHSPVQRNRNVSQ